MQVEDEELGVAISGPITIGELRITHKIVKGKKVVEVESIGECGYGATFLNEEDRVAISQVLSLWECK